MRYTDSERGSRFVERILTVVHTCRRQGKKVLDFLGACILACQHNRAPPFPVANHPLNLTRRQIPGVDNQAPSRLVVHAALSFPRSKGLPPFAQWARTSPSHIPFRQLRPGDEAELADLAHLVDV